MDKRFLLSKLETLKGKTFKILNIFEESYDIKPFNGKDKKVVSVKYPKTYSQYVDFVVKEIEGLVRGFDVDIDEDIIMIDGLNRIKHSLLTVINIGKPYYKLLRQRIFKIMEDFSVLIKQIEVER